MHGPLSWLQAGSILVRLIPKVSDCSDIMYGILYASAMPEAITGASKALVMARLSRSSETGGLYRQEKHYGQAIVLAGSQSIASIAFGIWSCGHLPFPSSHVLFFMGANYLRLIVQTRYSSRPALHALVLL